MAGMSRRKNYTKRTTESRTLYAAVRKMHSLFFGHIIRRYEHAVTIEKINGSRGRGRQNNVVGLSTTVKKKNINDRIDLERQGLRYTERHERQL